VKKAVLILDVEGFPESPDNTRVFGFMIEKKS
jgi:hypothetical protein